jgi:hypothetical protein
MTMPRIAGGFVGLSRMRGWQLEKMLISKMRYGMRNEWLAL